MNDKRDGISDIPVLSKTQMAFPLGGLHCHPKPPLPLTLCFYIQLSLLCRIRPRVMVLWLGWFGSLFHAGLSLDTSCCLAVLGSPIRWGYRHQPHNHLPSGLRVGMGGQSSSRRGSESIPIHQAKLALAVFTALSEAKDITSPPTIHIVPYHPVSDYTH